MCDGDRCDSKNNKVIGPDDSEDEIWWLPWWLVEAAIPVISGVNPQARADYIDKDQGDASGGQKRFQLFVSWLRKIWQVIKGDPTALVV